MPEALELWSAHSFSPGVSAHREMDVTGANNFLEAIAACNSCPTGGVSEGSSYVRDRDLVAGPPFVHNPDGPTIYRVEWDYESNTLQPPQDENGGVDRRPIFDWEPGLDFVPAERTAKKEPIVNAVGDLYDPPLLKPEPFLRLGFTRWEAAYDPQLHINFAGKKNGGPLSIRTQVGDIGLEAGQLMCLSVAPAGSYRSTDRAVPVTYRFEMRKTFKRRVMNAGRNAWYIHGTQPIALGRICNARGEPIDGPVRLDKQGKPINTKLKVLVNAAARTPATPEAAPNQNLPPLDYDPDSTADAVWILFDMAEDASFGALGL